MYLYAGYSGREFLRIITFSGVVPAGFQANVLRFVSSLVKLGANFNSK